MCLADDPANLLDLFPNRANAAASHIPLIVRRYQATGGSLRSRQWPSAKHGEILPVVLAEELCPMSFSPFRVESLEQRRLLSGGGNPLGSATVFVPNFGCGGVGYLFTRQGTVNCGFEQFPALSGCHTARTEVNTPAE